jgi:23S rRNA pseudouridine1911/1915/1917 synthase
LPPILFADETMLAIDKPAGIPVIAERRSRAGTAAALMPQVQAEFGAGVMAAHRLEPEVSGVLLCARQKPALDFLSGQFQGKTARRVFHALVVVLPPVAGGPAEAGLEGPRVLGLLRDAQGMLPESFTIEYGLEEDRDRPGRLRAFKRKGGRPARTVGRTLERFGRFAWVECEPDSARLHQVGAHLAAIGAPVLNDALHGAPEVKLLLSGLKRGYKGRADEKPLIERLALHASRVTVRHPVTREPLTIESPLPPAFEVGLKYLRKFAGGR